MLNEIQILGEHLQFEDEDGLHFRIKKTINNGTKLRLIPTDGGNFELDCLTNESCDHMRIVWRDKNNYLFSIKLPKKKFPIGYDAFKKMVKKNLGLWDEFSSIPEIKEFQSKLQKLDTNQILDKIMDFKIEKDVYLVFDLTLLHPDIYQVISRTLYSQESGEKSDIFGNQLCEDSKDPQLEFFINEGKFTKKILLKVYSRDENVKCYSRYNIKDKAIGAISYSRAHKILTYLAANKCIRSTSVKKSKKESDEYKFLCNLKELTSTIEKSTWNPQELIDALLLQRKLRKSVSLLVYRENGNFPQSVVFSDRFEPDDLKTLIEEWRDGCANIPNPQNVKELNVRNLFDYLSQHFYISSGQLCSRFNHGWRLEDSFLFLENKPAAIEKALRLFVRDLSYYSSGVKKQDVISFDKFIKKESVCGLILHKKGIDVTNPEIEDNPAYLLGQLFNTADWAQKEYFSKRKKLCPSPSLGAQKLNACYNNKNPHRALVDVDRKIAPYLAWARLKHGFISGKYATIRSKIDVTKLPNKLSLQDMAIMGMGYWKRSEKTEKEFETNEK